MTTPTIEITEEQFQRQVIDLAKAFKWRVHHTRPARRADGSWYTPIQGDKGFPDLVLAKAGRIIFAELKTDKGRLTHEQKLWEEELLLDEAMWQSAGIGYFLWRPRDIRRIEEVLRH